MFYYRMYNFFREITNFKWLGIELQLQLWKEIYIIMICRLGFGLIDLQPLAFSKCTFFNVIRVPYLSYLAYQRETTNVEDGIWEKILVTQFGLKYFWSSLSEALKFNSITYILQYYIRITHSNAFFDCFAVSVVAFRKNIKSPSNIVFPKMYW